MSEIIKKDEYTTIIQPWQTLENKLNVEPLVDYSYEIDVDTFYTVSNLVERALTYGYCVLYQYVKGDINSTANISLEYILSQLPTR